MHITKIEPQKKNPTRKNLYVDGEFLMGISTETLLRFGLRTGDEIGREKLKALQAAEELHGAKRAALRFLSYRPRTIREVRDKLREREFGDEEINQAIRGLQQSSLLDDAEFARMYIRDARAARPTGKLLLKQKLLLLGVDKEIVNETIEESYDDASQEAAATEAAKKFLKRARVTTGRQDLLKLRNRLGNFLGRRGFTWDIIAPVLKSVLKQEGVDQKANDE